MVTSHSAVDSPQTTQNHPGDLAPVFVLAAGFIARLIPAGRFFLNPDEALHQLLSDHATVSLAYKAALTNAHPPLLILILYYCRAIGHSEFILRMPSVLAGTACCWLAYKWLKLVADRATALIALVLLAFAPTLIFLSAEIRQYAILMFFVAACLYLSERAVRVNSLSLMVLFSLSLYGALLVHYSSLLFAFSIGVYMLLRMFPYSKRFGLVAVWAVGQLGGVAISAYYLLTHVRHLRQTGMLNGDFETYLKKSIFHTDKRNAVEFAASQTLRVFTYLFSHGVIGALALVAFLVGIVFLLKRKAPWRNEPASANAPSPRLLALLIGLPFVVNCAAAFAGQYPYGGTRHTAFLLIFAVSGISIGLACIAAGEPAGKPKRAWATMLVILIALGVCNAFPAPPPLIRPRNQNRALMSHAMAYLHANAAPGSIIFADYESGLLLGYYACGHGVVQQFPPYRPFVLAGCARYTVITPPPNVWKFYADDLQSQLAKGAAAYDIAPGTSVWFFYAGWIVDSAPAMVHDPRAGCVAPQHFGENIFLCQLRVGAKIADSTQLSAPGK
jgi:Dolichyl-phosphate-mannose-protein mannosyltransferase